jgi:Mg-chelatase subunit ChlI
MIDPRFANAGGVSLVPGYGAQQVPVQYHHHRHHRHHKHKVRNDASPISLDESIHKVDHGHYQQYQQQQQQQQQHHQQQQQQHHQQQHHHHHFQQSKHLNLNLN